MREAVERMRDGEKDLMQQIQVIHTISECLTSAGTSNNSRKNHARKVPRLNTGHEIFKVSNGSRDPSRSTKIIFTEEDVYNTVQPHDNPMVISVQIVNCWVHRVLIDTGSSVDIIFMGAHEQLNLKNSCYNSCTWLLYGFTRDSVMPMGSKIQPVIVGEASLQQNVMTKFIVVDTPSAYNAILEAEQHPEDLCQTFQVIRKNQMRLNPTKCAFGVAAGKFMWFMVHERGIEANPEKIKAILDLKSPGKKLKWDEQRELAFQTLKEYLASPPLLVKPLIREELQLYLAVSEAATSGALVKECSDGVQRSVYYVSRAFTKSEKNYTFLEKLAYTLARTTIKAQALADFIMELSMNPDPITMPDPSPNQTDLNWHEDNKTWILYTNVASSQPGCEAGTVMIKPEGVECSHCFKFEFKATNNEIEYEALLAGLGAKGDNMEAYLAKVREAMSGFKGMGMEQGVEILPVNRLPCWMNPIAYYLQSDTLTVDPDQARKLKRLATRYCLVNGYLYRKGKSLPVLRCLHLDDAAWALDEVHSGDCGNHAASETLAYQILRICYFWPTIYQDAKQFLQSCEACHKTTNLHHLPLERLSSISTPYPFAIWGLNLIGPLPTTLGQAKHAIVAIDYFTHWVEAKALVKITKEKTTSFVIENIVCRFSTLMAIISNMGKQFDNANFRNFCKDRNIDLRFASVAYPQTNGLVEATNKTIKKLLKKKLQQKKGLWVEELPNVLWAYRTTKRTAIGETSYSLVFRTEAGLPIEHNLISFRAKNYKSEDNEAKLKVNLDLLEEKQCRIAERVAVYQSRIARHFNKRVRTRSFKEGDLVLRRVTQSTRKSRGIPFSKKTLDYQTKDLDSWPQLPVVSSRPENSLRALLLPWSGTGHQKDRDTQFLTFPSFQEEMTLGHSSYLGWGIPTSKKLDTKTT
ncbi:hypothetical protein QYF36_000627 [Acer negundo]|nr:hypothetical protein QYF36_000627 [Acer negundo]